jgi:hypothetical protein
MENIEKKYLLPQAGACRFQQAAAAGTASPNLWARLQTSE